MSATAKTTAETIADAIQAGETTLEKCKERVKAGKLDAFDVMDAQSILTERAKTAASKTTNAKTVKISAPGKTAKGEEIKGGFLGFYGFNAGRPTCGCFPEHFVQIVRTMLPDALRAIETSPHVTAKHSTVDQLKKDAAELRTMLEKAGFKASAASAA